MDTLEQRSERYYLRLFSLATPFVIQHLVSIALNLVDNIMVGRLGAMELAGVGAANQVFSIYSMLLFGMFSGAAVLVAQYYGARDFQHIRMIVGMDVAIGMTMAVITFIGVQLFAPQIIGLFADEPEVIEHGVIYLRIIAFSYLMVGFSFAISYNCRPIQRQVAPAVIEIACILVNTFLNYCLIYGNFGMPKLGVAGAAYATLIARALEVAAYIVYLIIDKSHPFHGKLREFTGFGRDLFQSVLRTATPVLISEGGWALGVALVFAAYGQISAEALAVMQVSNVVCSFCQCAIFGLGNASAALTGEYIGRGDLELAFTNSKKFLKVQWVFNGVMTGMILLSRGPIAYIYQFDDATTEMLTLTLGVFAFTLIPRMAAYSVQCGILRAGGDTFFCMVVELACNLVIEVALAYFSVLVLELPLHWCIIVASAGNLIKAIVEFARYYSRKWINVVID